MHPASTTIVEARQLLQRAQIDFKLESGDFAATIYFGRLSEHILLFRADLMALYLPDGHFFEFENIELTSDQLEFWAYVDNVLTKVYSIPLEQLQLPKER